MIDPHLYVAEYQTEGTFDLNDLKINEQKDKQQQQQSQDQLQQQQPLQQLVQAP